MLTIVQNVTDNRDAISDIKVQMEDIARIAGTSQSSLEAFAEIAATCVDLVTMSVPVLTPSFP